MLWRTRSKGAMHLDRRQLVGASQLHTEFERCLLGKE